MECEFKQHLRERPHEHVLVLYQDQRSQGVAQTYVLIRPVGDAQSEGISYHKMDKAGEGIHYNVADKAMDTGTAAIQVNQQTQWCEPLLYHRWIVEVLDVFRLNMHDIHPKCNHFSGM